MQEQDKEDLDRRIFARISAQFSLSYQDGSSSKNQTGVTYDMNANGIGFTTKNQPDPDAAVDIWVHLPDNADPFYAKGRVVWTGEDGPAQYRAGVQLEKIELMKMARLLRARRYR